MDSFSFEWKVKKWKWSKWFGWPNFCQSMFCDFFFPNIEFKFKFNLNCFLSFAFLACVTRFAVSCYYTDRKQNKRKGKQKKPWTGTGSDTLPVVSTSKVRKKTEERPADHLKTAKWRRLHEWLHSPCFDLKQSSVSDGEGEGGGLPRFALLKTTMKRLTSSRFDSPGSWCHPPSLLVVRLASFVQVFNLIWHRTTRSTITAQNRLRALSMHLYRAVPHVRFVRSIAFVSIRNKMKISKTFNLKPFDQW